MDRNASNNEESNINALIELLTKYHGLLDENVEVVAKVLTQVTLASSDVPFLDFNGQVMKPIQRIRASQSLAVATSSRRFIVESDDIKCTAGNEPGENKGIAASGNRGRGKCSSSSSRRWHTQKHLRELQSEGVTFTKGKFTDTENQVIETAMEKFVQTHDLTREEIYNHLFKSKTRDGGGKQLRKKFWPILAEALPERQIQAIYHHVRRKCHPYNNLGAWSSKEDNTLRRLVAEHGPSWEAISGELGRMGTNCRDRWRYIQQQQQREVRRTP